MNFILRYFFIISIIFGFFGQINCKKLGALKMCTVSFGIAVEPELMVNALLAEKEAINTLNMIDLFKQVSNLSQKDTNLFIQKYKDQLVAPLDVFLSRFRDKGFIVIPLLKESLGANSMLERLFNSDSSISTKSFYDKEVQSIGSLSTMSNEFITFFNDLDENLSVSAKSKYKKELLKKSVNLQMNKS